MQKKSFNLVLLSCQISKESITIRAKKVKMVTENDYLKEQNFMNNMYKVIVYLTDGQTDRKLSAIYYVHYLTSCRENQKETCTKKFGSNMVQTLVEDYRFFV